MRPCFTWAFIKELYFISKSTRTAFACRMIQHEMSHLDGDLFVDHVPPIRKKIISKKLMNISKGRVPARYITKIK